MTLTKDLIKVLYYIRWRWQERNFRSLNTVIKSILILGLILLVGWLSGELLEKAPAVFFFLTSVLIGGGFVSFFFRNVMMDGTRDNPLNHKYLGVLFWGLLINILSIYLINKKMIYAPDTIKFYTDFSNYWIIITLTITFSVIGWLCSRHGFEVIKQKMDFLE